MRHIPSTWIMHEFAHASLGDARRTRRLCQVAAAFAHQPAASLPQACGDWGQTLAAYRFLDNRAVSAQALQAAHRQRTIERAAQQPRVLAVSDTTSLNYSGRAHTTGLGPISNNREATLGLLRHSTLAFTPQREPLGVLEAHGWARDARRFGENRRRNGKPIGEKESRKWLESLTAVQTAAGQTPQTRWVWVADREADIYEVFEQALARPEGPSVVVRVQHDRGVEGRARTLFRALAQADGAGTQILEVPRQGTRAARTAHLSVRFTAVTLQAPWLKEKRAPLALWAVEVREAHPPRGAKALHWRLLTTEAVENFAAAIERVQWYTVRWQIEVYHRVLKSGCRVEQRQLQSAEGLERALAVDQVVAWRVMVLSQQGRETPGVSVAVVLEEGEWKALYSYVHRTGHVPKRAPRVGEALRWVGRLGGHLGRTGDGAPGPMTLWRGLQRLHDIADAWNLFHQTNKCV